MTQKSIKVYLAAVAATEIPPIVSCADGRYCAHVFLSTFTLPQLVLKKKLHHKISSFTFQALF